MSSSNIFKDILVVVVEEYSVFDDEWQILGIFTSIGKANEVYEKAKKRLSKTNYRAEDYLKKYIMFLDTEYSLREY